MQGYISDLCLNSLIRAETILLATKHTFLERTLKHLVFVLTLMTP